ncbi:GNAT family N-acetyltransferase [Megasphaera cerevisiae]|uniref:GNAT family N-acetyltransferase n=1 Tax=Megasphaera cerevisiae TaxID=39029 RepID=UPI0009C72173|nr:GNAT family N-acetyltransferase [Megasphaera cerevisiae]SJZ59722.1 N-acetylglutamate synthase, GNAT family [Megasphaera cerevisiae DSM 20462]
MEYRQAIETDIPEIVQKRIQFLHEYHQGLSERYLGQLIPKLQAYFEKHLNKNMMAYIAADETARVCSVALLLVLEKPPRPAFMNGRTGLILNVYTEPEFRRFGMGKRLMEMLLCDARSMELDYVELTATADGYPLYQQLGFHEEIPETVPMKLRLRTEDI